MTTRLAVQLILTVLSAVLFLATLVWPEWIEALSGVEPDQGSGALELAIAAVLAFVAVAFGLLAGTEWKRVRATGPRSGT
jgi:uncharacterized membrane protein